MRSSLILIALSLGASCQAPRASESTRAPEGQTPVAVPSAPEPPPAEPPPTAIDPALRPKLEQLLAGYGYVPDAATLKAFGAGTFETLSAIAEDEELPVEVRVRALASLSYLDDRRVATELLRTVQGAKSPLFLRTALFGLARVKGNAAVGDIAPYLQNANPTVRLAAAEALGRLGSSAARAALQARLDGETNAAVRDALARALSKANP